MNKAQASTEIFFAIGFIMLFFILITFINFERSQQTKNVDETLNLRDKCLSISNAVSSVYTKGPGGTTTVNLNNNRATFNINSQTLMIEDIYSCTIPIKDFTDGVADPITNPEFTIQAKNLKFQNINNKVYINIPCINYPISHAEDHNARKLTSQLKYPDNIDGRIHLRRRINTSIQDYNEYLVNHNSKIAMIDAGNACTSTQQNNILSGLNCAQITDTNPLPTGNCHLYKSFSSITQPVFLNNLNDYKIIIIEDEMLPDNILNSLESWLHLGGILIFGGRNIALSSRDVFGIKWNYKKISDTITVVNDYYINSDFFLSLGGDINSPASWSLPETIWASPCQNCIPNGFPTAVNYTLIGRYTFSGQDGYARWVYGLGEAYLFASICHNTDKYTTNPDRYLTVDVGNMIKKMIGTQKFGYINATIDFEPQIDFPLTTQNQSSIEFNFFNVPQPPPYDTTDYNVKQYEKVNNDFYLAGNNYIEGLYQQPVILNSWLGSSINYKTEFIVHELNLVERYVDINYQDLIICYEY